MTTASLTLAGKIHTFNTGRRYAVDGQRISWALVKDSGKQIVAFIDHSRMIEGAIDVHFGNLDLLDNDWVLNAYHHHHVYNSFAIPAFLKQCIATQEAEARKLASAQPSEYDAQRIARLTDRAAVQLGLTPEAVRRYVAIYLTGNESHGICPDCEAVVSLYESAVTDHARLCKAVSRA